MFVAKQATERNVNQKATTMQQLNELLEQANEKCGNYSKLAEMLGVSRMLVSQWKTGAKPCPPEEQARIAEIAGFDPVEALVNAVIERHAGTPKGEALCRVLRRQRGQNKKPPEAIQGAGVGGNGGIRTLDEALHPILP